MTKVNIISGFLGAGKTTLIKKLLDGAFEGEKVVLLENEYGEVGIDGGFLKETGIVLAAVGLYSYSIGDDEASKIHKHVHNLVMAHEWALQMHGFYVDTQTKEMTFDVVMSFDIKYQDGLAILYKELGEAYPDYSFTIVPDVDISD